LQEEHEGSPLARPWRCVPLVRSPEWLLTESPVRSAAGEQDGFRVHFRPRRRVCALVPIAVALAAFLSLLIVNDSLGAPLHSTYIKLAMYFCASGALGFVVVIMASSAVLEVTPKGYSLCEKGWLFLHRTTLVKMSGGLDELQGCRVRLGRKRVERCIRRCRPGGNNYIDKNAAWAALLSM
jgi:hypothetical protein